MTALRTDPNLGEILAIPLSDGRWAYAVCRALFGYLVSKVQSRSLLPSSSPYLNEERWHLRPIDVSPVPLTWLTIGRRKLTESERFPECSVYWPEGRHKCRLFDHPETDWWKTVSPNGRNCGEIPITAEEAATLPEAYVRIKWEEFEKFLDEHRQSLVEVEGDPNLKPPPSAPAVYPDVQFVISGASDSIPEVIDEIGTVFEEDGLEYDTDSETYTVAREESSRALNLIRKAAKRVAPKEEWEAIEIQKLGPKIGQEQVFALEPKRRKRGG